MLSTPHQIYDQIKEHRMSRGCNIHGGDEKCIYRLLVGKPEGKRPLGGPRHRDENNSKMVFQEME
jgi:hypothetical protein